MSLSLDAKQMSMFLAAVALVAPLWAGQVSGAASCRGVFSGSGDLSLLNDRIRKHHDEQIYWYSRNSYEGPTVSINGIEYKTIGRFTNEVVLAETAAGELVVIKEVNNSRMPDWVNSIYYEVAATQYYQELGLKVAPILDYEIAGSVGYVVKEFRTGLEGDELKFNLDFLSPTESSELRVELARSIEKYQHAHSGFSKWLERNGIDLHAHPFRFLDRLIQRGDAVARNFIFDVNANEWVLFDP